MCKQNPCNDRLFCINSNSEDCLYLNIFTPINACSTNHPKAVMVYIHGGSFVRGTGLAPVNFGNTLAEKGDVIVVTINYRLGIFGWLATGKYSVSDIHGNYCLKDQQMALKWVNENIKAFGGNPDKVTIFGDGDGAESVGIHMTNNRSEDFFSSSIMMSAPFTIPFKTYYSALFQTQVIAQILGCSIQSLDVMITFLRANADSDDLLRAQNFFLSERIKIGPSEFVNAIEPIGPVIDYDWVPPTLVDAFKEARQKLSKPVMLGSVREEGVRFLLGQNKDAVSYVKVQGKVRGALVNRVDPAPTAQELVTNYPLSCVNSTFFDAREVFAQITTDFLFTCPARKVAEHIRIKGGNYWLYFFDQALSSADLLKDLPHCVGRVCHGVELPYVFNVFKLLHLNHTAEEAKLAKRIGGYFSNFAKYGNPNRRGDGLVDWRKFRSRFHMILRADSQTVGVTSAIRGNQCRLWDKIGYYDYTRIYDV